LKKQKKKRKQMRFGFVTCVELGLSCMQAIYEIGGRLELAITLPDDRAVKKSGRIWLDSFCADHAIPLVKSPNVNDAHVVEAIREAAIDWLFIIGWSQIARDEVLAAPRRGVLGMHPTLLPVGRGRAAIPWAILKGLDRTGVTLFRLDGGVDTGDILDQIEIPLTPATDATALYAASTAAHVSLIKAAYPLLLADALRPQPQDEAAATLWPGRKPEDGEIDLAGTVADAERLVRAVTRPYPGAFTIEGNRKLILWRARIAAPDEDCGGDPCLAFRDGRLRALDWEAMPLDAG
jgi:methionyl-tRNA formyltransferase